MKPYYPNFSYSFYVKITVSGVEEWLWLWGTYPHSGWSEHLILQIRPAVDMKTWGLSATGFCTLKNPRQLREILAIFQTKLCQHWELIRPYVVTIVVADFSGVKQARISWWEDKKMYTVETILGDFRSGGCPTSCHTIQWPGWSLCCTAGEGLGDQFCKICLLNWSCSVWGTWNNSYVKKQVFLFIV